jgi:glycosyltransferase involved in cell wall biosynthesis
LLDRPVEVRPPNVPIPRRAADPGSAPPRALFLGDYSHHPNPEAAAFLARRVWPLVLAREPRAELWLAGPRAEADVKALANLPGVRVLGYAEDLEALLRQVRLMLVPLFSGGGSRIKVLTALAHGLPVVSNELGLRGVDAPRDAVQQHETAETIAAATLRLLGEPGCARQLGAAARRWIQDALDPERLALRQLERVRCLLRPRPVAAVRAPS